MLANTSTWVLTQIFWQEYLAAGLIQTVRQRLKRRCTQVWRHPPRFVASLHDELRCFCATLVPFKALVCEVECSLMLHRALNMVRLHKVMLTIQKNSITIWLQVRNLVFLAILVKATLADVQVSFSISCFVHQNLM